MNTRLLAALLSRPGLPWLLLLLTVAPGCSVLNLQQPTVSFRSVKVSDLSPAGLTADFDVDVQNPNVFEIPVNGAAYKLTAVPLSIK